MRWKQGHVWIKFGDWEGAAVKPCADEHRVAGFLLHLIEARVSVHLVEREQLGALAAAYSHANESEAGLGGWWLPSGCQLDVAQIRWFSFRVRRADPPHCFAPGEKGAQKPSLQALFCDNFGVVGAASEGLAMKEPVAAVLQSAAAYCMREKIDLRVSHVAGMRNEWADKL